MEWSKEIAMTEPISEERKVRWKKLWVPYHQLPESVKEQDRVWARKVMAIVNYEKN